MKLHQKGFLLIELSKIQDCWDSELVQKALQEYGLSGSYWINSFSVALDELASAGLIARMQSRLDDGSYVRQGRVMFRYRLTDFGRERMRDTGLLT